jgi:hypothetical protein
MILTCTERVFWPILKAVRKIHLDLGLMQIVQPLEVAVGCDVSSSGSGAISVDATLGPGASQR